jgi:predicted DNA-binding protein (MmcQ/YjbR family)
MNIELFRAVCLSFDDVTEEFPFGPDTLVYKTGGKIFAIGDLENFSSIALKCDPELAVELREQYAAVKPGYHLNKKHWNSVDLDNSISDKMLKEWIFNSYSLVRPKPLTKKK